MPIKHHHINIGLFILYIISMTAFMIWQGIGIAPDRYAFVLLLGSLLIKRTRAFILDWLPFLFILLTYDFLRGLVHNLAGRAHVFEMINFDKWLFNGQLPPLWLQNHFFSVGHLHWYDFLATIFYFLHFALPLGFGFILWLDNRQRFRQFVIAILLLSYAGWITYVAFPATPPWLAANQGNLPGVQKILDYTLASFPDKLNLPTVYNTFDPNPVAAMPSMHAAYPFLVFLFAMSFFGLRALFFLPYVFGVWISVIYLGEHYVADVLAGILYATVFFFLTKFLFKKFSQLDKSASTSYNLSHG